MAKQLLIVDLVEEGIGNVRAYILPLEKQPPPNSGKSPYLHLGAEQAQEVMEATYPHLKSEMKAGDAYHFFEVDEIFHDAALVDRGGHPPVDGRVGRPAH